MFNKETKEFYDINNFNYNAQKKKIDTEINKISINPIKKEKIERYIDKYTNSYKSNYEKMSKIIYFNLLPDELKRHLKESCDITRNIDDSNEDFILNDISSEESKEESRFSEEASLENGSDFDFEEVQNDEYF